MAKKQSKTNYATAGEKEKDLESSKKTDLPRIPHDKRHLEMTDAVVHNNIQSRYHGK